MIRHFDFTISHNTGLARFRGPFFTLLVRFNFVRVFLCLQCGRNRGRFDMDSKELASVCGIHCGGCEFLGGQCAGCNRVEGKPFWTSQMPNGVCPLYDCCVNLPDRVKSWDVGQWSSSEEKNTHIPRSPQPFGRGEQVVVQQVSPDPRDRSIDTTSCRPEKVPGTSSALAPGVGLWLFSVFSLIAAVAGGVGASQTGRVAEA